MDPLSPLVEALHAQGRLRVWSLVITAFGDLVQHRGGEISTARLGQLLGRVGVEQGALRTALSRLNRDGWVTSARDGRTSLYRLSPQGLERFAPATTRIYAPPRATAVRDWALSLVLGEGGAPSITLAPADSAGGDADCRVVGRLDRLSPAYRAMALTPAHRAALSALAADLQALPADLMVPLDAAAGRLLLIHRWRRIVLRFADIPPEALPSDAPLADPRRAVMRAYQGLVRPAERWLDGTEDGLPAMPPARAAFAQRFGGLDRA